MVLSRDRRFGRHIVASSTNRTQASPKSKTLQGREIDSYTNVLVISLLSARIYNAALQRYRSPGAPTRSLPFMSPSRSDITSYKTSQWFQIR